MKEKFSTIGIFAHANAGKTTITENLLFKFGIIDSIGKVDDGNTATDGMQVERRRGISVRSSVVSFELENNKTIQLIDTPGHIDFSAEVERTISVLDSAILVISAADGVEPQTFKIWKLLKDKNVPVIIFVNKIDRVGVDFERVLNDIRINLDENIVSLVNLIENEKGDVEARDIEFGELLERVSEIDEVTLEKYIEDKKNLSNDWLDKRIKKLIKSKKMYPVIAGSALKSRGIKRLVKYIKNYAKFFEERDGKFSAFVYMIRNENGARNLYTKILAGNIFLKSDVMLGDKKIEKISSIFKIKGGKLHSVKSATSGEIVVLNGLSTKSGDFIGENIEKSVSKKLVPLLFVQIEPKNKKEVIELVEALRILSDEDPYLEIEYDAITSKIFLHLMGVVQGEIIQEFLHSRFNIEVNFLHPTIKYQETATKIGIGRASYTQFSDIEFEITPLDRGSGIVYNSKLSTDYLHKKYQSQAEKLIKRYARQGVFGWQVTDVEISLTGGRFNSAGSHPSHFNIAVPIAFMRALKDAQVQILEPISSFRLEIPSEYKSIVIDSLNNMEARYLIEKEEENKILFVGNVLSKKIINYSSEIIKITGGLGSFSSEFERYAKLKGDIVEREYYGLDPRNETRFIKTEMNGSLEIFDMKMSRNKKASRSKFKRK